MWGVLAGICLFAAIACGGPTVPHRLAPNTVVLANADDPASVRIARAYQDARGIPDANIVLLPVSEKVAIDRAAFVKTIWNPLRITLLERGLMEGERSGELDLVGREQLEPSASSIPIRYLVVCRGVPVKIAEAPELDDTPLFPSGGSAGNGDATPVGPQRLPPQLRKNHASVDSELALLMHDGLPMTGPLPNPLFKKLPSPRGTGVVRVSRLDGPTPESVLRMISNTIRAETIGLRGRAYFDLAARKGSYQAGDNWISRAADLAAAADFDVTIDTAPAEMGIDARFDSPAIYFGWYAGGITGVFQLPDLAFPPGAIVAHLHSASASNLRNAKTGWVGPLVASGVTATVGNVYEPYLEQTHHFDILLEGLLQGMNFGDAAYAALPGLSWQTIAVGDPLYEPAWVGLEEQLHLVGDLANAATDPLVVMRKMNRLLREGKPEEARILGLRALYQTPGASLALKVAELEAANGDFDNARRRLEFAAMIDTVAPQQWALFHAIARRLAEWNGETSAAQVYANLLADDRLPKVLRLSLLEEGVEVARKAGRMEEAVAWRQKWHALK